MEKNFADLLEIMRKECDIYDELKSVEEEKKKIIIDNDVKALEAITKKEQGFVKTIVHLESLRAQVIDGFCKLRGISNVSTLDDIVSHLDAVKAKEILDVKNRLVNIVNELMQVNDLNTSLLEQSIEYINYTLDLARSLGEADLSYDNNLADVKVNVGKNLFDAKV